VGKTQTQQGKLASGLRRTEVSCSYVATVVEVEVNTQVRCGSPAWIMVVDAGLVVNPESTRAQFEAPRSFGTAL